MSSTRVRSIIRPLIVLFVTLPAIAVAQGDAEQELLQRNHEIMSLRTQLDDQIDTSVKYDRDIAKKFVEEHGDLLEQIDGFDQAIARRKNTRVRLYDRCLGVHGAAEELKEVYDEVMGMKKKPEQLVKKGDLAGYGVTLGQLNAKVDEACKASARLEAAPKPPPVATPAPGARPVVNTGALEADIPQIEILSTKALSTNGTRRTFEVHGKVRGGVREPNSRIALLVYRKGQAEPDKLETARGLAFRFPLTVDDATDQRATVLVKDMKSGERYEVDVWRNPGR